VANSMRRDEYPLMLNEMALTCRSDSGQEEGGDGEGPESPFTSSLLSRVDGLPLLPALRREAKGWSPSVARRRLDDGLGSTARREPPFLWIAASVGGRD
jgi:hypothetical protein